MTFKPFDIVVVPFPYADLDIVRKRPAVVLSDHQGFGEKTGIIIAAMISAPMRSSWPFDTPILGIDEAGLQKPSLVRMKLMAIGYALIDRKLGQLSQSDSEAVSLALRQVFPFLK